MKLTFVLFEKSTGVIRGSGKVDTDNPLPKDGSTAAEYIERQRKAGLEVLYLSPGAAIPKRIVFDRGGSWKSLTGKTWGDVGHQTWAEL